MPYLKMIKNETTSVNGHPLDIGAYIQFHVSIERDGIAYTIHTVQTQISRQWKNPQYSDRYETIYLYKKVIEFEDASQVISIVETMEQDLKYQLERLSEPLDTITEQLTKLGYKKW